MLNPPLSNQLELITPIRKNIHLTKDSKGYTRKKSVKTSNHK